MQAREVGQIGMYIHRTSIDRSIRVLCCCNPSFFATKATTRSSECPLQEAQKNFSRRQNQTSASYVHCKIQARESPENTKEKIKSWSLNPHSGIIFGFQCVAKTKEG
jgi:hypothetical protein